MGFPYPVVPQIFLDGSEVRRKRRTGKMMIWRASGNVGPAELTVGAVLEVCSFVRDAGFEKAGFCRFPQGCAPDPSKSHGITKFVLERPCRRWMNNNDDLEASRRRWINPPIAREGSRGPWIDKKFVLQRSGERRVGKNHVPEALDQ